MVGWSSDRPDMRYGRRRVTEKREREKEERRKSRGEKREEKRERRRGYTRRVRKAYIRETWLS